MMQTFISDLAPGDVFRIADFGTVYVVESITTWGPQTRVNYRVQGQTGSWTFTRPKFTTVDKHV